MDKKQKKLKGRILYFLSLLLFLCGSLAPRHLAAQEQTPRVERSSEKVVIGGKVYYIHIVRQGQTLYSISKAYGVPEKEISRENPVLVTGLQPGMVLKIPYVPPEKTTEEEISRVAPGTEEGSYILHTMKEGETLFSLSRQYHVSVEEILEENPGLHPEDIPLGTVIRIPRKKVLPEKIDFLPPQGEYRIHEVQPGETLFSIARTYGLSVRELKKANKGLHNRIRPGQQVRIPLAPSVRPSATLPVAGPGPSPDSAATASTFVSAFPCDTPVVMGESRSWKIALLMPLYLRENAQRSYVDSSRIDPVTGKRIKKIIYRDPNWIFPPTKALLPYYEGVVVALDTLGKLGYRAEISIFDTEKDLSVVDSILRSGALDSMDLVIGPVYPSLLSLVSEYLREKGVPLISPLSRSSDFLRFNPYAFQCRPSRDLEDHYVSSFLASGTEKNIVIIHADDSLSCQRYERAKNYIFQYLPPFIRSEDLVVREVMVPNVIAPHDTMNNIRLSLEKYRDNLVWVLSDEEGFVSEVVARLNTYSEEYPIHLVGNSTWRYFRNLELEFFYKMNLRLFTTGRVQMDAEKEKGVIRIFRRYFGTDPDEMSFAWYGYDEMVYFLSLLRKYGKAFEECTGYFDTSLGVRTFRFRRTGWFSGFMNTSMEMLEYREDYTIQKVPYPLPGVLE